MRWPLLILRLFLIGAFAANALIAQTAPLKTTEEVMAAFWKVNGGDEGIEGIRSIRARGTIHIGDQTVQLTMLRKRPNKMRITLQTENLVDHRGFDGEISWHMLEAADGRKEVTILEGEEKQIFEAAQAILGTLFLTEEDGVRHELVGVEYVGRIPAYVINTHSGASVKTAYLDSRTFRVLKFRYNSEKDPSVELIDNLSNYTKAGKVWMARKVERLVNSELDSIIEFDRIEVNNGIFDSVFSPPTAD